MTLWVILTDKSYYLNFSFQDHWRPAKSLQTWNWVTMWSLVEFDIMCTSLVALNSCIQWAWLCTPICVYYHASRRLSLLNLLDSILSDPIYLTIAQYTRLLYSKRSNRDLVIERIYINVYFTKSHFAACTMPRWCPNCTANMLSYCNFVIQPEESSGVYLAAKRQKWIRTGPAQSNSCSSAEWFMSCSDEHLFCLAEQRTKEPCL